MLFDICQMLNEINRGYLPHKGTKEVFTMKDLKNMKKD